MPINKKNQKEESRSVLLRNMGLPKATRAIVVSYLKNSESIQFLQAACTAIGVTLIVNNNDLDLMGADIWITDDLNDKNIPIEDLSKKRVVPVVPMHDSYKEIFSEFDPMKFTGNAFIFQSNNPFMMFEKLIRALENMRYAGDKRMLLENVETIKC